MSPLMSNIPPNMIDLLNADDGVAKRLLVADGDYQILPGEQVILVDAPGASTTTITLPTLASTRGQAILVVAMDNAAGTITVEEQADSFIAFADKVLTVAKSFTFVENVAGLFWREIESSLT